MPSEDQEDDYGNKIVISNVENLEGYDEEENQVENIAMDDLEVRDDLSNQINEPNMETEEEGAATKGKASSGLNKEVRAQKYVKQ